MRHLRQQEADHVVVARVVADPEGARAAVGVAERLQAVVVVVLLTK